MPAWEGLVSQGFIPYQEHKDHTITTRVSHVTEKSQVAKLD